MPKINVKQYLSGGKIQGAGSPQTVNPNIGRVRGVGVGSLSSAVPRLRQRDIIGMTLDVQRTVEPLADPKAVNQFAGVMANTITTVVAENNKLYAQNAFTSYRTKARELQTAFLSMQGREAVDSYQKFQQDLNTLQDQYLKELNPGAREIAMKAFMSDRESMLNLGARHVVSQRNLWKEQTKQNAVVDSFMDLNTYKGDLNGAFKYLTDKSHSLFDLSTEKGKIESRAYFKTGLTTAIQVSTVDENGFPILGSAKKLTQQFEAIAPYIDDVTEMGITKQLNDAWVAEKQFEKQNRVIKFKALKKEARKTLATVAENIVNDEVIPKPTLDRLKYYVEEGAMGWDSYKTVLKKTTGLLKNVTTNQSDFLNAQHNIIAGKMTDEKLIQLQETIGTTDWKVLRTSYVNHEKTSASTSLRNYRKQINAYVTGMPVRFDDPEYWDRVFEFGKQQPYKDKVALANQIVGEFDKRLASKTEKTPQQIFDDLMIEYKVKGSPVFQKYVDTNRDKMFTKSAILSYNKLMQKCGGDPTKLGYRDKLLLNAALWAIDEYNSVYINTKKAVE